MSSSIQALLRSPLSMMTVLFLIPKSAFSVDLLIKSCVLWLFSSICCVLASLIVFCSVLLSVMQVCIAVL